MADERKWQRWEGWGKVGLETGVRGNGKEKWGSEVKERERDKLK